MELLCELRHLHLVMAAPRVVGESTPGIGRESTYLASLLPSIGVPASALLQGTRSPVAPAAAPFKKARLLNMTRSLLVDPRLQIAIKL